ncbi:GNAT family N-acetyltransferase [Pseudomonas japonica]|uniref:GNAT family N-acetyltransferase n=1 Tax=Pseudomonas japonica TaxID=256466 RepID=UPI0015E3780E|nr:GNAT family N-acetyltransferase [Pseudomonas japonica]MBA1287469.1 GNAT family N-acetyltransferase [Pseudomonas japonica]
MEGFVIRQLVATDAEALLAFELENREWFETHIEARPPAFYCLKGVAVQIDAYLSGLAAGTRHPFVIEGASGLIVGRANLKNIDLSTKRAEVGYRIAGKMCGRGLATRALEHLIEQARIRWGLRQLVAYVYEANAGSKKVLGRCGFRPDPLADNSISEVERRYTRWMDGA